jgi:hypothetical protein
MRETTAPPGIVDSELKMKLKSRENIENVDRLECFYAFFNPKYEGLCQK